jgi:pyruvate formate lyase activating enzyme
LKRLKERGFAVKLDTNGLNPTVLEECLPHVDYVALDLKTSPEKYNLLGVKEAEALLKTVEILKSGKVEYELRTTVVPKIVEEADINRMGEIAKGAENYALQQFVSGDTLSEEYKNLQPYPPDKIAEFAETLKKYVENVVLRV